MIAACLYLLQSYSIRCKQAKFHNEIKPRSALQAFLGQGRDIKTPASLKESQNIASALSSISSFCALLASVPTPASTFV